MDIEEPMAQEKPPCEFCTHEAKLPTEEPCIDCERIGFAQWSQYQPMFAGSPSWGDVLYYLREQNQYGLGTIVREGISHIKQLKLELEEARKDAERTASIKEALKLMLDRFDRPTNIFSQRLACEKARKALQGVARQQKDAS